jgi:hypothetical protein
MLVRAVVGIAITVVLLAFALKRGWFLVSLARVGKPAVGRTSDAPKRVEAEATEVLGQRKLLKWTVPGIAHVFAFWGFLILGITVVTAFGELVIENFSIPIFGTWQVVRFMEDLFAILVLIGIVMFAIIRLTNNPAKQGRASRFFGSHTKGAWLVLLMIFLVVATLLTYRGAKVNNIADSVEHALDMEGAFASQVVGGWLAPLEDANLWVETVFIWFHITVILAFLLIVLHSKHCTSSPRLSTSTPRAGRTPSGRCCRSTTRASPSTSRIRRTTPPSARGTSPTSPGRTTSTSWPARSAAAASPSARPGTPASP